MATDSSLSLDSLSELQLYYNLAKRESKPWHDGIKKRRNLYNGKHYTTNPKPGEERYVDPSYGNVVDLGVGILLGHGIEWKATGWRPSSEEQGDSSKIEKYIAALVSLNDEREEMSIEYETLLHFLRDGCAVLYSVWDTEIDRTAVTSRQIVDPMTGEVKLVQSFKESPLRLQVIDPLNIFLKRGGRKRWSQVFHVEKMSVYDAEEKYGIFIDRYKGVTKINRMQAMEELVNMWQIADVKEVDPLTGEADFIPGGAIQNGIMFAGQLVQPIKIMDGYKDLPFTVGFFKPVERDDAKHWTQSIIDPLESTIQLLEKSINRRSHQIDKYTGVPLVVKSSRNNVQIDLGFGNSTQIGPDEDISFPAWSGNPPDVQAQIEFFRSRSQQSGFSDVMFGSGASSSSGYALSQLGDQNRIRLEQPVTHLEMMWSIWAKKALGLTAAFAPGYAIQMYGRLKGVDFADQLFDPDLADYKIRAEIKPEFPNEQVRKHAMATQVRNLLSDSTIMEEYLDIDQPDDERARRIQEMVDVHPAVIQYNLMLELTKRAKDGDTAAFMALNAMSSPQPQQGRPPGGGGSKPIQPTGMMSATGQPTQQEQGGQPAGQSPEDQLNGMINMTPSSMSGELE